MLEKKDCKLRLLYIMQLLNEEEMKTKIYFKKLAHWIIEADNSKICRVDKQAGVPADVATQIRRQFRSRISSSLGNLSSFSS